MGKEIKLHKYEPEIIEERLLKYFKLKFKLSGFFIEEAKSKEEAGNNIKEHLKKCIIEIEKILNTPLTLEEDMDILDYPDCAVFEEGMENYEVYFIIRGFMFYPRLARIPPLLNEVKVGDELRNKSRLYLSFLL